MEVTNEDEDCSWIGIALDLVEPEVINTFEAFLVGDIVDQENSMSA
jgi:hypothetical protein